MVGDIGWQAVALHSKPNPQPYQLNCIVPSDSTV